MRFLFEGFSGIQLMLDPHELRVRIRWKSARQLIRKCVKLKIIVGDHCRHAGSAICARHGYAVGDGIYNAPAIADHIINFAGCDIFALPAKSVADPVDEMKKP